jgi:predicted acetyltransferase
LENIFGGIMDIIIEPVKKEEKEILRNLLEKYTYEFSQYENNDVNNFGLYGYTYLDHYWTDEKRFAYFIRVNKKLAGFVMINDYPEMKIETNYSISEFFIMYKYRRLGIGKYVVNYILNKYKGKWQLKYHPKNKTSEKFWIKTIDKYTKGNYKLIKNNKEAGYEDGTIGHIIIFEI